MRKLQIILLTTLIVGVAPAWAESGLLWGKVAGKSSGQSAPSTPEWVCKPDSSGEQWACEGDTPAYVQNFDPESIGERPDAPVASADLAEAFFVPRESLGEAEQAELPAWCEGTYQEPEYPFPAGTDNDLYPVVTEADQIEYELGRTVTLRGDVRFRPGQPVAARRAGSGGQPHSQSGAQRRCAAAGAGRAASG